jgi:hypothetical protein
MNKQSKAFVIELLQQSNEYLGTDETPAFDSLEFLNYVSDSGAHTEAVLALAGDVERNAMQATTDAGVSEENHAERPASGRLSAD